MSTIAMANDKDSGAEKHVGTLNEKGKTVMDFYIVLGLLFLILYTVMAILFWNLRNKLFALHSDFTKSQNKHESELASQRSTIESLSAIVTNQFDPPHNIEALATVLATPDPNLRHAAEEILVRIGREAIKPLVTATKRGKIHHSLAAPVLMRCAKSEDDLLAILDEQVDQPEMCREVLKHPYSKEKVLNRIANEGPISVLPNLVSIPIAQGTAAQEIAQRRLQEAAEKRLIEENNTANEESSDSGYMDDDDRATGTCDCRWR